MHICEPTVTTLHIPDLDGLDPLTVRLEDLAPSEGRLTITCFPNTWSYTWGSMGKRSLADFILSCDEHYLAKKLEPRTEETNFDMEALPGHARQHIIRRRRDQELGKKEAKELYVAAETLKDLHPSMLPDSDLIFRIYGGEWWFAMPEKENVRYTYICRVINAVKDALARSKETHNGSQA